MITDEVESVKGLRDCLPFGEDVPAPANGRMGPVYPTVLDGKSNSTVGDRMLFTGKERDAETGLDLSGARYFSGAQGRFTSPDLLIHRAQSRAGFEVFLGEPQRWNEYGYASPFSISGSPGAVGGAGDARRAAWISARVLRALKKRRERPAS